MLIIWETGSEQLMDDANRNVAAVLTPCKLHNDCQAGNADVVWTSASYLISNNLTLNIKLIY